MQTQRRRRRTAGDDDGDDDEEEGVSICRRRPGCERWAMGNRGLGQTDARRTAPQHQSTTAPQDHGRRDESTRLIGATCMLPLNRKAGWAHGPMRIEFARGPRVAVLWRVPGAARLCGEKPPATGQHAAAIAAPALAACEGLRGPARTCEGLQTRLQTRLQRPQRPQRRCSTALAAPPSLSTPPPAPHLPPR